MRHCILGSEHPDTLRSMNNLAATLKAQDDLAGARKLQERVLEMTRRILGDEHPDTLTSMNNLAMTLKAQGDLAGAREIQERVLEMTRRILGDEHPDTLASMNNLALTLQAQGNPEGAREIQERARVWGGDEWLYSRTDGLTPAGGPLMRTLEGHSDWVNAVAVITPDGKHAISGSRDYTLKVWDIESGEGLWTLGGHTSSVWAVAATSDGKHAISASGDKTLKVWDIESGEIIASFSGERDLLTCAVSPDGKTIVTGDASGRVHLLRLQGIE